MTATVVMTSAALIKKKDNKLAELSTLLAGHDIPKSPDGWVRLYPQILQRR